LFVLSACGGAPELLLSPAAQQTGVEGARGPYGVSMRRWMFQARITEGAQVDVLYPSDAQGELDRTKAPYPVVLFIHGGLVRAVRYRWLAQHIASRGYVVLMSSHLADLALAQSDNSLFALDDFRKRTSNRQSPLYGAHDTSQPVAVMGHSLGGVTSVTDWMVRKEIKGLCLLGAWPASSDPIEIEATRSVLSLTGQHDERSTPARVLEGFQQFKGEGYYAVIDDMNHFDWTDNASASELATDGPAAKDLAQSRTHAQHVIDSWLDMVLKNDSAAQKLIERGAFKGISSWTKGAVQ
tara:strand:+ start:1933 stop:2820 length:888 start_codon:yes stop_codon:yes gene_type:complete